MLSVALTGNIAAGKSAVAELFRRWGATLIDADRIVREVQAPGSPVLREIVRRFGDEVLGDQGELDRPALRRRVMDDPEARAALNRIVHPAVYARRAELVADAEARGDAVVVSDIPLLFETADPTGFDVVVLVDAPEHVRLARLRGRRGLNEAEARAMIRAQMPAADKRARSDFVIDNDGDLHALERAAATVWRALLSTLDLDRVPAYPPTRHPTTEPALSNVPDDLVYTKEHEYVARTDDPTVVRIGITDYAQGELGDVVFVNLPKPGEKVEDHQSFGTIEAVKAVSELYAPVAGEVAQVNGALESDPAVVNRDPYGEGWMIELRLGSPASLDGLLSPSAYRAHIGE